MTEEKELKVVKKQNPLVGAQAVPTTLDKKDVGIGIDTSKELPDAIIHEGLEGRLDVAALDRLTTMSNSRDQMYQ